MTYSDTVSPSAPLSPDGRPHLMIHRRVSGTAIVAGLIFAFAIQIVLGLFGSAIGLSMVHTDDPSVAPDAGKAALATIMWAAVSMLIAVFYGAFLSARISGNPVRTDGILHGVVVWAASVLIAVCLMTSAIGGVFSGVYHVLNGAAGAVGSGIKMAHPHGMENPNVDAAKQQAMDLINGNAQPRNMTPDQAQADIAAQTAILARSGDGAAAAHDRIVADLETQGVAQPDAEARVQDLQNKMQAAKEKAKQTADKAAHATAKATVGAGVALLLGAFVACLGGALGALRAAESLDRHHGRHTAHTTTTN